LVLKEELVLDWLQPEAQASLSTIISKTFFAYLIEAKGCYQRSHHLYPAPTQNDQRSPSECALLLCSLTLHRLLLAGVGVALRLACPSGE